MSGSGSRFGLYIASAELVNAAASYETTDMMDVREHMDLLQEVMFHYAAAFSVWAGKLLEAYPVNHAVVERLFDLYTAISKLAIPCTEISGLFQRIHEQEITRRLKPRRNEHYWNAPGSG